MEEDLKLNISLISNNQNNLNKTNTNKSNPENPENSDDKLIETFYDSIGSNNKYQIIAAILIDYALRRAQHLKFDSSVNLQSGTKIDNMLGSNKHHWWHHSMCSFPML